MVPNRLVMNSINEYKFLDETWVRLGIFFHCMRGRLMMVIPLNVINETINKNSSKISRNQSSSKLFSLSGKQTICGLLAPLRASISWTHVSVKGRTHIYSYLHTEKKKQISIKLPICWCVRCAAYSPLCPFPACHVRRNRWPGRWCSLQSIIVKFEISAPALDH